MTSKASITAATQLTGACSHEAAVNCGDCRLSTICLPFALETRDIEQLDRIIQRGRPLHKGRHLYHQGDEFTSVYAVRSGTLKAYHTTNDGREQITGFYFPGEIVGMDGISQSRHASSACALETAAVCEIPFSSLETLSARMPQLQRHFFQLMSREITDDQQLITLLSKSSADARVAALLFSISVRNARRQLSARQFRLSMTRVDIGNYLGLTVETVSRVFSRLQKAAVVQVNNREISILDEAALKQRANGD